jgi:transcriptional regulator with XRE-family HTH domain
VAEPKPAKRFTLRKATGDDPDVLRDAIRRIGGVPTFAEIAGLPKDYVYGLITIQGERRPFPVHLLTLVRLADAAMLDLTAFSAFRDDQRFGCLPPSALYLARHMVRADLTAKALSGASGVSVDFISDTLRGKRELQRSHPKTAAIAQALGITVDALFAGLDTARSAAASLHSMVLLTLAKRQISNDDVGAPFNDIFGELLTFLPKPDDARATTLPKSDHALQAMPERLLAYLRETKRDIRELSETIDCPYPIICRLILGMDPLVQLSPEQGLQIQQLLQDHEASGGTSQATMVAKQDPSPARLPRLLDLIGRPADRADLKRALGLRKGKDKNPDREFKRLLAEESRHVTKMGGKYYWFADAEPSFVLGLLNGNERITTDDMLNRIGRTIPCSRPVAEQILREAKDLGFRPDKRGYFQRPARPTVRPPV